MNSQMWFEELKDDKKTSDGFTKDQLMDKYKELDRKVDRVLEKIKRRHRRKRYEEFTIS